MVKQRQISVVCSGLQIHSSQICSDAGLPLRIAGERKHPWGYDGVTSKPGHSVVPVISQRCEAVVISFGLSCAAWHQSDVHILFNCSASIDRGALACHVAIPDAALGRSDGEGLTGVSHERRDVI